MEPFIEVVTTAHSIQKGSIAWIHRLHRVSADSGSHRMAKLEVIAQQHGSLLAGDRLLAALRDPKWTIFRAAVAFAKHSGVRHIASDLRQFATKPGNMVSISIGISSQGTSLEGLQDLWQILSGTGNLYVFHEGQAHSSFHPKLYLFQNKNESLVIAGSTNLTEGGLFVNHEFSFEVNLYHASSDTDRQVLQEIEFELNLWQTPGLSCMVVDPALLIALHGQGDLPSEATIRVAQRATQFALNQSMPKGSIRSVNFGSTHTNRPPIPLPFPTGLPQPCVVSTVIPTPILNLVPAVAPPIPPSQSPPTLVGPPGSPTTVAISGPGSLAATTIPTQFLIEVRPHHNGEVFLSYSAVKQHPAFFQYPFTGLSTPRSASNAPYPMMHPDPIVEIIVYDIGGNMIWKKSGHSLNVIDYHLKREIRITVPNGVQIHIPVMSLLIMTKSPDPVHDYRLEFWPPGSPGAIANIPRLINLLPTGGAPKARRYGWI
jgi:HKD family nuclease